jgi:hypothetical protein
MTTTADERPTTMRRSLDRRARRCTLTLPLSTVLALAWGSPAAAQVWEVGNFTRVYPYDVQGYAHFGAQIVIAPFDGPSGPPGFAIAAPGWDEEEPDPPGPTLEDVGVVVTSLEGRLDTLLGGLPQEGVRFGAAMIAGDFDADGRFELVIGEPGYSPTESVDESGEIAVLELEAGGSGYMDWDGIFLSQDSPGMPEVAESGDWFAESFAVGRFNGDAYPDLAIGMPHENLETEVPAFLDAGAVIVLYGGVAGLSTAGSQVFTEEAGLGGAQSGAFFGRTLAAGDFDGDGFDDLAIGAPLRDVDAGGGLQADAGEVVILRGTMTGLTTAGYQRRNDSHFGGAVQAGDSFGAALAAADFSADAHCLAIDCYADLAIGVPGQLDLGHPESGKVLVVYGSATGLDPEIRQSLYQDLLFDGGSEPADDDRFGEVLTAGALRGPYARDLAIGVPREDVDGNENRGMVHLVFGGPAGLLSYSGQFVVQRQGLASWPPGVRERFGGALAIADLNGDLHGDLAIGIPWRNVGAVAGAGMVQVLYGALFADGFESSGFGSWSP